MEHRMRVIAALLVVLALVLPAAGWASDLPEGFDAALAADGLALVPARFSFEIEGRALYEEYLRCDEAFSEYGASPVPDLGDMTEEDLEGTYTLTGEEHYGGDRFISMSPDGNRLLMQSGGMFAVLDFEAQSVRLAAPAEGLDPDYVVNVMMHSMVRAPQDFGVAWSPDGRYVAFTFVRETLMQMRLGMNVILFDVDAGLMWTVDEVPVDVSLTDMESFTGAPYRAAFDPQGGNILYYDVYAAGMDDEGDRYNELRAYDISSGVVSVISQYDGAYSVTASPEMFVTGEGVLQAFADARYNPSAGLALRGFGGEDTLYEMPEGTRRAAISPVLRDYREGVALMLYQNGDRIEADGEDDREEVPYIGAFLSPFRFDSPELYPEAIYIEPGAEAGERVKSLDLTEYPYYDPEVGRAFMEGELVMPYNGVLSPDGKYLLVAARDCFSRSGLYLIDLESGECGAVELELAGVDCAYSSGASAGMTGMSWVSGNRVMLLMDGDYQVFEFEIGSR